MDYHALTPEIISRQPTINIGMIGHVSHGKTTLVRAVSGVDTIRYKCEKEKNITMKLGYANAKIYSCSNFENRHPNSYTARGSNAPDSFPCPTKGCSGDMELLRHISFVDCPGHDVLMSTMLNGVSVMDAAVILVAANMPCPQPQTREHLAAVEIMGLENLIVVQNKIDLVGEQKALDNFKEIKQFVNETVGQDSPVIPISAQMGYNIDLICETIVRKVKIPQSDFNAPAKMMILRSFDINKPHSGIEDLKGGVIGGSILRGTLAVGDAVEIRPGLLSKNPETGKIHCRPLKTTITSLRSENNPLDFAVSGGLIAVGTNLDPSLTKGDRLVGHIIGHAGSLPEIYTKLFISYKLLNCVLGSENERVGKLGRDEILLINIGSFTVKGKVVSLKKTDGMRTAALEMDLPCCCELKSSITMSRKIRSHWRLIGKGEVLQGKCEFTS